MGSGEGWDPVYRVAIWVVPEQQLNTDLSLSFPYSTCYKLNIPTNQEIEDPSDIS